ncbi:FAD-dependent oxidoreductase [Desulfococcus sp.]|uniref:FAD-dependent oxidoreductase n=1 Tax=Desulfococcus sp. TaxID=2025834 RepID=UPI00359321BA
MLDWLIIGGGVHGTHLSNLLLHEAGVPSGKLAVIDPFKAPLTAWRRRARACGMPYLRSPATHNIDLHILSVHRFARTPEGRPTADFIPNYYRPSTALFERHCDHVVRVRGLAGVRVAGLALAVRETGGGLMVSTNAGPMETRRVILTIGPPERPCWPGWALALRREGVPVSHVFDPAFRRPETPESMETVIIGGGITAVQAALALAPMTAGRITLISRHPLRIHNLDFDPCWIGPKCLRSYAGTPYPRRRAIIDAARHRGTVPEETAAAFDQLTREGRAAFRVGRVREASWRSGRIRISTDDGVWHADRILLATGFGPERPGGSLTDQMVGELGLETEACGYPVLDEGYRWHPRIFVTGALAELRGGPCARNIVGARNAGREILKAAL